ncbi:MAG: hypothetical protein SFY32_00155 [Bacteroidota bacterium]|nr:hypothetical protein [Bacteroidota bacterium]
MASIKDKLTEDFLISLKEIEPLLLDMNFKPYSFYEKGPAYFIEYKNEEKEQIVKFLFGPSDWMIEMIIFTPNGKFEFKDLFKIPAIAKWLNDNNYLPDKSRNIKKELLWLIEYLKYSLSILSPFSKS